MVGQVSGQSNLVQPGEPYIQLDSEAGSQKHTSVQLRAVEAINDLNGMQLRHHSFNGNLVGPTIRVKPGTQLKIHLQNDLPQKPASDPSRNDNPGHAPNTTNLIVDGLLNPPTSPIDGIFKKVRPSQSFEFVFDIHPEHPAGTFWYHPHKLGSTAFQLASGMSGALIVEGGLDTIPEIKAAQEKILILQQFAVAKDTEASGHVTRHAIHSGVGELIQAVNGVVTPTMVMRPGEVQRWRIIHAGTTDAIVLVLEGILFQEVAVGGLATGQMQEKKALILYPGDRSDVLVQAPMVTGTKHLYSAIRDARISIRNQVMQRSNLMKLVIEGEPLAMQLPSPDQLERAGASRQPEKAGSNIEQGAFPDWVAMDRTGKPWSNEMYRGKLVMLVLHRGMECLHCAEQLSRLKRENHLLRRIGVNVVAISPNLPDGQETDQILSEFPFPVLIDPSKDTFRAFGCMNDSDDPLHGLFLLDQHNTCLFAHRSETAVIDPTGWVFEKLQLSSRGDIE
jgi:FtsP/CotA-like multicopper oxidase with cupredoxin domain